MTAAGVRLLICQVGTKACGIPLASVRETLRPLPVSPLVGTAPFVRGLSLIRGRPTPVVVARLLLAEHASELPLAAARLVTLRVGRAEVERVVALEVDGVVGVRELPPVALAGLPGLLRSPETELVHELATLDAELLLILEHTRLVPDSTWERVERGPDG